MMKPLHPSRLILLAIGLAACLLSACRTEAQLVVSPDGHISAQFYLDSEGTPCISVKTDRKEVFTISTIGFTTADNVNLNRGFHLAENICRTSFNDTATLLWGENKIVESHYNSLLITLLNNDSIEMLLELRVAEDGVAFQFEYTYADSLVLTGESTTYSFAHDGTCWSIPANFESYEFAYREQPLSQTSDANTPFTFHLPACSIYGSIHEAALYDMPEMTLVRDSLDSLTFHTWLSPDNTGSGTVAALEGFPKSTWRTLTLGRKAVDLINSSLILNCNWDWDDIYHTTDYAWSRPLKYIGIWWGMHLGINSWTPDHRHGATTANALRYIDFAAENHIDAVLFEGWNRGWEQWGSTQIFDFIHAAPDFDVERVIAYAHEKGVQIIMHHETGGNIPHYEAEMEQAFQWCQDHGIHYVKTGYAGGFPNRELHHSQYGVKHYQKVVQCAADHQIALDVHEPIKPTGLCRTFPNLMTGEGARGMEWNAWSDGNSPAHTTILPFTRLLAGPMDYTPGIFDITYQHIQNNPDCRKWNQRDARECRVHTTLAKQCALWVVIYSPMVMAADLIENYQTVLPDGTKGIHPMFQFFRDYNPDCDWSRALEGEPGQYVVIARRAGNTYYLGAVTNEQPRDIDIPLDFLPNTAAPYTATLYADGENAHYETNPTSYKVYTETVTAGGKLHLHLAPGGGCAVVIRPH